MRSRKKPEAGAAAASLPPALQAAADELAADDDTREAQALRRLVASSRATQACIDIDVHWRRETLVGPARVLDQEWRLLAQCVTSAAAGVDDDWQSRAARHALPDHYQDLAALLERVSAKLEEIEQTAARAGETLPDSFEDLSALMRATMEQQCPQASRVMHDEAWLAHQALDAHLRGRYLGEQYFPGLAALAATAATSARDEGERIAKDAGERRPKRAFGPAVAARAYLQLARSVDQMVHCHALLHRPPEAALRGLLCAALAFGDDIDDESLAREIRKLLETRDRMR